MKQSRRPHVALIVETSKAYGRGLLRGITRYVRSCGPWSIYIDERGLWDPLPEWLRRWKGDGMILRTADRRMARSALRTDAKVVYLGEQMDLDLPMVHPDDRPIARLAAEHLLERGFRQFGFVGIRGISWSEKRRDGLTARIAEAGCSLEILEFNAWPRASGPWEQDQRRLVEWIAALPRPIAIMACYDVVGLRVLDACRRADVAVPEEVAVIGVDNDEILCDLADPPLSSVAHDLDRIGYEAASLLDRLMSGQPAPASPIFLEPLRVVARQSTDTVAVSDPVLARALRFIREHACDGIGVSDLGRETHLSRRTLERRFFKELGCTPHEEILRAQLDRVKRLLLETDLPLEAIAGKTGFAHTSYMVALFRRKTGQTPGAYRKAIRAQGQL